MRPFLPAFAAAALVLAIGFLMPGDRNGAAAATGKAFVYIGEGAFADTYTLFATATGKTLTTASKLPADLTVYDCVVLPLNGRSEPAFSAASTSTLVSYLNGGGRVIAEAEFSGFAGGSIAAMNGLASAMGADLSVISALIDDGFFTTTNIDPSPFTAGVASIRYAASSEVAVGLGPDAHSLVRSSTSGKTIAGIDKVGNGVFALFGDSNILSDNSDSGYADNDNDVLAANICAKATFAGGSTTPPSAPSCTGMAHPSSTNAPAACPNQSGPNAGGFFVLTAPTGLKIVVVDKGKDGIYGTADDASFGPFLNGTKIKYVKAIGAKPSIEPGSAGIDWMIKGNGDVTIYSVDAAGTKSDAVPCQMAPPPKT